MDKLRTADSEKEYNARIQGIIDKTLYSGEVSAPGASKTVSSPKTVASPVQTAPRRETAPISLESFDKAYDRHMRQVHEQLEHSRRLAQQVNAPSAQSDRAAPPPPPKRVYADMRPDPVPDETILLEEASTMARRTVTSTSWQDNTERVVVAASLGKRSSLEGTTKDRIAREQGSPEAADDAKPIFDFEKVKNAFDLGKTPSSVKDSPIPKVNAERLSGTLKRQLKRIVFRMTYIAVPGILLLYSALAGGFGFPLPFFWDYNRSFLSAGIINLVLFTFALYGGWDIIKNGLIRSFSLRINQDSVIGLSCLFTWLYGLLSVCIPSWRQYQAPFILPILWLFYRLLFRYYTFTARQRSVRAVSRYSEAETLLLSADGGYDGLPTYIRTNADGFNRFYHGLKTENPGEQINNIYLLAALLLSAILSVITAFLPPKGAIGGHIFLSLSLMFSMIPSCAVILGYSPAYKGISSRMRRCGAFIGGPQSFLGLSREGFTVVSDQDLFPDETISITDFHPCSSYDRQTIYRYTAGLLSTVGCSLAAPFIRAIGDDFTMVSKVTNLRFTGEAISADVDQHHIILGDDAAMRRAGFRINRMSGRTVIYVAIDAEIAASFSLNYNASPDTEYSLRLLIRNLRIPVIATRDFNITVDRVEKSFRIRPGVVVCPPIETRIALANPDRKTEPTGVVFLKPGIRAVAETIEGARRFKIASTISLLIGLASALFSLILTAVLVMNGWFDSASPANLLLYQLLWSLPSLFLSLWARKY